MKQDYEGMAVPMAWPVLRDLIWKMEMKSIDASIARVTQRAILVITMGYENKNGEYMFDSKAAEAMRALFLNDSVGKLIVCYFTTKVEWYIPQIDKLLAQEKYKQVNEDIKQGLSDMLGKKYDEAKMKDLQFKIIAWLRYNLLFARSFWVH